MDQGLSYFLADTSLLTVNISLRQVEEIARSLATRGHVSGVNEIAWALRALMLTDLTTLSGDDTRANVRRLCVRACYPFEPQFFDKYFERTLLPDIHCAAVCVYPARVKDAYASIEQYNLLESVAIAAVATGFPTGQYGLQTRLQEISHAINSGATEIDIVINRQLALLGDWEALYNEVVLMRSACADHALLKTILAVGELGTMENVSENLWRSQFLSATYLFSRFIRLPWCACWRVPTSLRLPLERRLSTPHCLSAWS